MKKILIVEDEESLQKILRERFEEEHFEVVTASDGGEGLGKAINEKPDIILLDILMPIMDGLTMAKKLRASPGNAKVPIIILTNFDTAENVEKALEEHAFDFLVKSKENLDEIVEKVRNKLK